MWSEDKLRKLCEEEEAVLTKEESGVCDMFARDCPEICLASTVVWRLAHMRVELIKQILEEPMMVK